MFRLDQEKDNCAFYYWLTLQYDDDHVPIEDGEMCFSKKHCRDFFEKLRKRYADQGLSFKHFLVSEYGPNSTHRPHYHCLLMVYSDADIGKLYPIKQELKEFIITKAWPHGHVTEKAFHGRVFRYLTKYCCKPEMIGQYHRMKPFTLISPGIGLSYLSTLSDFQLNQMKESLDFTVRYGNGKIQLPRYYVDKIMPHSLQDLRDSIPLNSDNLPDSNGDWQSYRSILSIRRRLSDKQYQRDYIKYKVTQKRIDSVGIYKVIASNDRMRQTTWDNFKSKIINRKDL